MTLSEFREIALALPETEERSHMGHPDFRRAGGRIFATLGYPTGEHGALMLTPEQQGPLLRDESGAFAPAAGAWGRKGSTIVRLAAASAEVVGAAMTTAWRNAGPKPKHKRGRPVAT